MVTNAIGQNARAINTGVDYDWRGNKVGASDVTNAADWTENQYKSVMDTRAAAQSAEDSAMQQNNNSFFSNPFNPYNKQYGGMAQSSFGDMSNAQNRYKFNQLAPGLDTLDPNYKLTSEELAGIQGSMAGLDNASTSDMNGFLQNEITNSKINDANAFDWGGAANLGMAGLNTAMNIGSYFDRKDFNKTAMKEINQNMKHAKMARQDRTDFLSGAKSAFASKPAATRTA